jgi:hypothetical protein
VSRPQEVAVAASVAWGVVVAVSGYAVLRGIQFFVYPDPNPATLVWSAHSGFFWRCWTVGYAGCLASFIAFLALRNHPDRAARGLAPALAASAILLGLQSLVLP